MNKLFEKQSQVLSCTLYASPYIQRMCESWFVYIIPLFLAFINYKITVFCHVK
jgi:hypothetical protein